MIVAGAQIKIDSKEVNEAYVQLGKLQQNMGKLRQQLKEQIQVQKQGTKAQQQFNAEQKKTADSLKETQKQLTATEKAIGDITSGLSQARDEFFNTNKTADDLKAELGKLGQVAAGIDLSSPKAIEEYQQLEKEVKRVQTELKALGDTGKEVRTNFGELNNSLLSSLQTQLDELLPDGGVDINFNAHTSEAKNKILELQQQITNLNAEANKLDGGENGQDNSGAITKGLGLDDKRLKKAQTGLEIIKEGLGVVGAVFDAQKASQLAAIDEQTNKEIQAVKDSTLSEEDKAKRIEEIKAESDERKQKLEKKAKKKQQKLDIITAVINTALAVTSALGTQPFFPLAPIMAGIAAAMGAAQIAAIAKQKYAQGGVIPFEEGGTISGPSHAGGGVPFRVGASLMEAEGGELIVNKGIWRRPDFVRAISDMNASTGGKRFFASGGVVPSVSVAGAAGGSASGQNSIDAQELVLGLRGVIAEEVGTLQVVNNVVDTSAQQTTLYNQQVDNSF